MGEIDDMDMLGFLKLRAWKAARDQKKSEPRRAYIDQIWPGLK
jgi:hypothetical protein